MQGYGTNPPVTVIKSDSTTIRQQELLIVQSQSTIESMQDSLEALTEKLTNVKPQYIIRYKDILKVQSLVIDFPDSLTVDSLTKALSQSQAKIDAFISSHNWIPVPRTFLDSGQFFKIQGSVGYYGVDIKDLQIFNNTSVVIGQKSSWLSAGPVVVNVAQTNPFLSAGSVQSYQYIPKVRKWTLVGGPAIIFNGRSFTQGIGLMAGYKIW